jgi:hypothetical protein
VPAVEHVICKSARAPAMRYTRLLLCTAFRYTPSMAIRLMVHPAPDSSSSMRSPPVAAVSPPPPRVS